MRAAARCRLQRQPPLGDAEAHGAVNGGMYAQVHDVQYSEERLLAQAFTLHITQKAGNLHWQYSEAQSSKCRKASTARYKTARGIEWSSNL
eukprot:scaffold213433_cov20-Prasinocladus_malaysianus.AAC.1